MAFMPLIGQDPNAPLPVRNVPPRAPVMPLQGQRVPGAPAAPMSAGPATRPTMPASAPVQSAGGLLSVPYAGARGGLLSLGAPEAPAENQGLLGGLNPLQAIGLALSGAGDLAGGKNNLANSLQTLLAMRELQQKSQGKPGDFLREINGQLVDLRTGQVVGDYRTPEEPKRDLFTVTDGDQIRTFIGDKGDPSSWQPVADADRYRPTTNTSVTVTGGETESEFSKTFGKAMGQQAANIYAESDRAASQLARMDRLEALTEQWEASGGALGPLATTQENATAWAQSLGVDPAALGLPEDAGPAQAIRAISNEMALGKIGGEDGMPANNFSDADRRFIQSTVPQITDTPTGLRAKIELTRRMSERAREKEMMWAEAEAQGKTYREFRREWNDYVNANPLFSEDERAQIEQQAAPKKAGGPIRIDLEGNIIND